MSVIIILVILALLIAGGFLFFFFWAVKDGQYDDVESPAVRILIDKEIRDYIKNDKNHI